MLALDETGWLGMRSDSGMLSVGQQLATLVGHLADLVPGLVLGAAVYDDAGKRLATSAAEDLAAFPRRLAPSVRCSLPTVETRVPDDVSTAPVRVVDGKLAMSLTRVARACPTGTSFVLAVGSATSDLDGLDAACRLGAWILEREVGLGEQAVRLRQLAQEQEAIIDHISDGLMVVDRSGVVRYMNAPAGRILALDPAASLGRTLRALLDFEPIIEPILTTGHGYADRELQIDTPKRRLHLLDTAVPIHDEQGNVVSIVNTFREMARVRQLSQRMVGDQARYRFADIKGESKLLREAVGVARRAARSDAAVLIYGESGTGKELFAQSIHADGRRSSGPFVAINCAALPRDLIESELFGYAPGSFTGADRAGRPGKFELASTGTIFLDEISEMPLDVQAKLLRVLQERQITRIGGARTTPIDVRIVAAANRDLRKLVGQRSFREDLYYRINVIRIDVPPLRARADDIDRLTDDAIERTCVAMHRSKPALTPELRRQLRAYPWPGNIRQLQNIIERLVNMIDTPVIDALPPDWLLDSPASVPDSSRPLDDDSCMSLEEAERRCIRHVMRQTDHNVTKSAQILGITRQTLYAKLKKHRLSLNVTLD